MSSRPTVTFIGGGVMAEAIIAGIVKGGLDIRLQVVEPIAERRDILSTEYGVETYANITDTSVILTLLVLAVKPQQFGDVAQVLSQLTMFGTVVSIMAGIPISRIQSALEHSQIVRVMPNTPAQIGKGATAWTATESVPESDRELVGSMLDCVGLQVYFDDEKMVDISTALSASGPAYVFMFMESLTDAAVQLGMPVADAKQLAVATVQGSAQLAQSRDSHLAELRNMVTSPGGTTAAALQALEAGNFRNTTMQAVLAAYARGVELSELG